MALYKSVYYYYYYYYLAEHIAGACLYDAGLPQRGVRAMQPRRGGRLLRRADAQGRHGRPATTRPAAGRCAAVVDPRPRHRPQRRHRRGITFTLAQSVK